MNAEEILKSIVKDKSLIKYHRDWGFYIETSYGALHKIGLIRKGEDLELSFYYGDSQIQSRNFYSQHPDISILKNTEWKLIPNFHFSSSFENLIWFDTLDKPERYIEFWEKNLRLLYQHNINELPELIRELTTNNVIFIDSFKERELESVIFDKQYQFLNVCAGFGCLFRINKDSIDDLLRENKLSDFLVSKINEGLSVIRENGNDFLIKKYNIEGDPPGF